MTYVEQLLEGNRRWAEGVSQETPDFFCAGAKGQSPEALWIGCSDSRLPESRLLDLPPGQLFVHRNIANQVIPSDINCLSVIQYAVEFLKVKHIIVCGHHGCGGVAATFDGQSHGLVDNWLGQIRDLSSRHADLMDSFPGDAQKVDVMSEINVLAQTLNTAKTTVVHQAWARGQDVTIHGWIYSLNTGRLHDLEVSLCAGDDLAEAEASGLMRIIDRRR